MILYFASSFMFELFFAFGTYKYEHSTALVNWISIFMKIYYLRFVFDFASCMLILYLMFKFGRRSREMMRRKSSTLISETEKQIESTMPLATSSTVEN